MSTNSTKSARDAFSNFERDMTKSGAAEDLREALDYALEIIDDRNTDAQSKQVAQNLINTYRKMLIERISAELEDTGYLEGDYYGHWMSLANIFKEAECDEDKILSELYMRLLLKTYGTLSKAEKYSLLNELQRDVGSK
jgi:hypothetical protein